MMQVSHEKINSDSYECRLEIQEPNKDKAGLYKCLVNNDDGKLQVNLNLNIEAESDRDSSTDNTDELQDQSKTKIMQLIRKLSE